MHVKPTMSRVAAHGVRRVLQRTVPLLGSVFGTLYVIRKMRGKGALRGGLDAALDLTPVVGPLKHVYELVRGDMIAPKKDPVHH